jgi:hypothetical protein
VVIKRVYLDQNQWIALAREENGVSHNAAVADALTVVEEAARSRHASFPLSAAHYFETMRRGNPGSRQRLGAFMARISKFDTMASAPDVLEAEVRRGALALVGARELPPEPQVFGRGFRHAFGKDSSVGYFQAGEVEIAAVRHLGAEKVFELIETAMITGPDQRLPFAGIAAPDDGAAKNQLQFERETRDKLVAWGHSSDRAHRLILVQECADVLNHLNSIINEFHVDLMSVINDREKLTSFLLSLAAKGAIIRLRMTAHENLQFRWQLGDLNDMTALGMAAAYCDVVVAENQWGTVLQRHQPILTAKIIRNLADLPAQLLA